MGQPASGTLNSTCSENKTVWQGPPLYQSLSLPPLKRKKSKFMSKLPSLKKIAFGILFQSSVS